MDIVTCKGCGRRATATSLDNEGKCPKCHKA